MNELEEIRGEYREMRDNIACRPDVKEKRRALMRLTRAVSMDARYSFEVRMAYVVEVIDDNRRLVGVGNA